MATDFNTNATVSIGGFKPSAANVPLDIRTRIATEADIASIPMPFIGMVIYVEDTGKRLEVLSLKDKKVGMKVQKNAAVDQYRELPYAEKAAVDAALAEKADKTEIPSVEGLASEEFVQQQIEAIEFPEGYDDTELRGMIDEKASKEELQNAIDSIEHPTVDLEPYAKKEDLFSGSYNDLADKPEIPSIEGLASEEFVQQQIEAIEFPEGYDDTELRGMIDGKADKSELFSGSYNDLADKPEIPSVEGLASEDFVEEKISEIVIPEVPSIDHLATKEEVEQAIAGIVHPEPDLSGFATKEELFSKDYNDLNNKPEIPSVEGLASEEFVQQQIAAIEHPTVDLEPYAKKEDLFSKDYNDLENLPEIPEAYDDSELRGLIDAIEVPSVEGLASEEFVQQQIEAIEFPEGYDDTELRQMVEGKADKSELFSGSYNDLTDKPEIPSVEGLASEEFVNQQIAAIEFPEGYDDTELRGLIDGKADKSELFSGSYNDLADKPEIPSVEGLASEEFVQQQIEAIEHPQYELPAASAEVLGGVKAGSNVQITADGVLNAANYQFQINMVEFGTAPSVEMQGEFPNITVVFNIPVCIAPEPEIQGKMWYGYIPYDETGVAGVMEPDQINENMKKSDMDFGINAGTLIEAEPGVVERYEMNAPDCAFICTIVPDNSNLTGRVDNGIGDKVLFTEMDKESELAQDDCVLVNPIDGITYRLSGLYVMTGGGRYTIYVIEK